MAIEDTELFKLIKEKPTEPNWMIAGLAAKRSAQAAFDDVLQQLGSFAPGPEVMENDSHYLARLGECAAVFGPEDRKRIDRHKLPGPVLAEIVREDLEIAKQEAHTPQYTLKPGILTERKRQDASGREYTEFYSASGPSVWMNDFADPIVRYVSGGSKGFASPDNPAPNDYSFLKTQTNPELVEIKRRAAYLDSAAAKVIQAYKDAGKTVPDDVLTQISGQ